MKTANRLIITWSTSRGHDTYGYNICRLDDSIRGRRFRTCGGGYDMIGTVLGDWLTTTQQDALRAISARAGSHYSKAGGYKSHRTADDRNPDPAYLYGMTRNDDTGAVTIDGACGVSTVMRIAEAIGLDLHSFHDRRGRTLGYIVTCQERAAA